jgi:hypothetical protein
METLPYVDVKLCEIKLFDLASICKDRQYRFHNIVLCEDDTDCLIYQMVYCRLLGLLQCTTIERMMFVSLNFQLGLLILFLNTC